jgi:hypothetical protein
MAAQAGAKEAHQVAGHGPKAAVRARLALPLLTQGCAPSRDQIGNLPASIGEGGLGAPDGCRAEPQVGQGGKDGPSALEEASRHQREQQMQQSLIGSHRNPHQDLAKQSRDTVDYFGHRRGLG